jgi:hypothetical protein
MAPRAPHRDGLPLACACSPGDHRSGKAHVTAGLASGIGLCRARAAWGDTSARRTAWGDSAASWRSDVGSPSTLRRDGVPSGVHTAACLLATPGFVRPLAGRHAGALLTGWLDLSQGDWSRTDSHPLGNDNPFRGFSPNPVLGSAQRGLGSVCLLTTGDLLCGRTCQALFMIFPAACTESPCGRSNGIVAFALCWGLRDPWSSLAPHDLLSVVTAPGSRPRSCRRSGRLCSPGWTTPPPHRFAL